MCAVLVYGLALLLWRVPSHFIDKISLNFSQGPENADVFMSPNEEETQQISEEVLKESKIIQEEIRSLLSEVSLVNVNALKMCFEILLFSFMKLNIS